MHVEPLSLPEVLLVEPRVYADPRGSFQETWNARSYAELGISGPFVQDNLSVSRLHTLRGLHYQVQHAQGKLVRVVRGAIYDVIVDLRRSSPHFGRHAAVALRAEAHRALWVPPGFAHGFLAVEDDTWVQYALGIQWPLPPGARPLLSVKDGEGVALRDADTYP